MALATARPTLENVLYEKKDGLARITLNRPKVLNALNRETLIELTTVFEDAREDSAVLGVILTASGYRAFIAGADISELALLSAVEAEQLARHGQAVCNLIENLGKPEIAAVNGFALGSGCEVAMACSIRLAAEGAKFGLPEVKFGIIPGFGGTQRLPRLVGKGSHYNSSYLARSSPLKKPIELVWSMRLSPPNISFREREAVLKRISGNAPLAIRLSIEAVNKGLETNQAEGLVLESSFFAICAATEDKKEGAAAFLEKRAPKFQGR